MSGDESDFGLWEGEKLPDLYNYFFEKPAVALSCHIEEEELIS